MTITGSLGLVLLLASLAVIPGPSDLLVAGCAVKRGYRSVVNVTLGILLADLIFILAVVYGATAWLEYFSRYQQWLVWLSSGVLIAFGIWMLRIRIRPTDLKATAETGRDFSFGAGFGITFFDPKALAFYFGVLPTFFDLSSFGIIEVFTLAMLISAVICISKAFYAWVAVRGLKLIPSRSAQSWILRIIGFGLIVSGAWRLLT
jgi:threonine/homoserine/homoserine lactone efflux protein